MTPIFALVFLTTCLHGMENERLEQPALVFPNVNFEEAYNYEKNKEIEQRAITLLQHLKDPKRKMVSKPATKASNEFKERVFSGRPIVTLFGINEAFPDKKEFIELKGANSIAYLEDGTIDAEKRGLYLTYFKKDNGVRKKTEDNFVLPQNAAGTCIMHDVVNGFFCGDAKGGIYNVNFVDNKIVKAFDAHQAPINALALDANYDTLISRDADSNVYLWNIQDTQPRVQLHKPMNYSKDYISKDGSLIVRSHVDRGWISGGGDKAYKIPNGWLNPKSLDLWTTQHAILVYLLKKIDSNTSQPLFKQEYLTRDQNNYWIRDIIPLLKNSNILENFQPAVTAAMVKFLDQKEKELSVN